MSALLSKSVSSGRCPVSNSSFLRGLIIAVSAAVTGVLLGLAWTWVSGASMGLWLMARASGVTAYLLLTAVTLLGLLLSHPARARLRWPAAIHRLRLHMSLTIFTLAFLVLHIVVLVLDPWAKVGVMGAILPMGSEFRPLPVTLGLLSLWAGIITGFSAALAGRSSSRFWLPLHRFSAAVWVLAWLHGVLAGSDTAAWMSMYVVTGLLVIGMAAWRYASASSRDRVRELAEDGPGRFAQEVQL